MKIRIIGVVPPCPRCERIYDLTVEVVHELGLDAEIKKIASDSADAQECGKVGTAHDIAEWAHMEIDWGQIRNIPSEGWSRELDEFLMPCRDKAVAEGWLMTPVLLIDDKVSFMGYVPDKELIKTEIMKHHIRNNDTE